MNLEQRATTDRLVAMRRARAQLRADQTKRANTRSYGEYEAGLKPLEQHLGELRSRQSANRLARAYLVPAA